MKKYIYLSTLLALLVFSSCSDWLTQEEKDGMEIDEIYSSEVGITSIAANLYSRLRYEQDFTTDPESYDLTSWDEATNNSQYWSFAGNKGAGYREYYDYGLMRDINLHLQRLEERELVGIPEANKNYLRAEARYLRAHVYFTLVSRMGGVPLITIAQEYTNDPLALAKKRNTEVEVYDYIADELDAIADALDTKMKNPTKTRASKATALALKCRAMLYAGSLAYNADLSASKGLNLPSGATGIPKADANRFLKKSIEAFQALEAMNTYSLYKGNTDLSTNYYELFTEELNGNPEIIFAKAYDGVNFQNGFTRRAIPRTQRGADKSGAQINPVLNLVNDYELLASKSKADIDAYVGDEIVEEMSVKTSTHSYNIYDNANAIFAGRDPRLQGTIVFPGTTFRGKEVELQAGLAIQQADGSYKFLEASSVDAIETEKHDGIKITGADGPFRDGDNCWYISHTGFLLRKYVDPISGSEIQNKSSVAYIVFRYGEALLNAAEAAYLLNSNGEASYNGKATVDLALDYINQVRERAGGVDFRLSASELTFERIVNERRVELSFEDHRYNDLKRWRLADKVWAFDRTNPSSLMYALWPYKIYAPSKPEDGKWLYRKLRVRHRGNDGDKGMPLNFDNKMYYATYPMTEGNPLIEKNPNH